jgi:hypothetical protein
VRHVEIYFLLVLSSIMFTSCADMMRSLQNDSLEADRPSNSNRRTASRDREEPVYRPRTLSGLSANNVSAYDPPVQRNYGRALASAPEMAGVAGHGGDLPVISEAAKRITKQDFVDNDPKENSLWDGQGQSNYLFTHNKKHELGDVVGVDVARDLKREIQYALFMNLPPEQRKSKRPSGDRNPASVGKDGKKVGKDAVADAKAAGDPTKSELEKGKDAAEEAAKSNMDASAKDDDTMRMEVVENLSGGMVRLLGQKRVVYRGVSRVVEVVALANSRDVDENARIKSASFIDTKTQVIQ